MLFDSKDVHLKRILSPVEFKPVALEPVSEEEEKEDEEEDEEYEVVRDDFERIMEPVRRNNSDKSRSLRSDLLETVSESDSSDMPELLESEFLEEKAPVPDYTELMERVMERPPFFRQFMDFMYTDLSFIYNALYNTYSYVAYFWYGTVSYYASSDSDSDYGYEPETDEERIERFADDALALFSASVDRPSDCGSDDPNLNIESVFYDRAVYDDLSDEAMKALCEKWRSRVLIVASPLQQQSNIIMYYDPSRLAFAYHSDFAVSSPSVLNAAAMKYVVRFRCLDFIVDEDLRDSPLKILHSVEDPKKPEEREETKEKEEKDQAFRDFLKQNADKFIAKKEPAEKDKKKQVLPIVVKNRFVYKSKVAEFRLLEMPAPKKAPAKTLQKEMVFGVKPSMDCLFEDVMGRDVGDMFSDASVQTSSELSYKAFKAHKNAAAFQMGCFI